MSRLPRTTLLTILLPFVLLISACQQDQEAQPTSPQPPTSAEFEQAAKDFLKQDGDHHAYILYEVQNIKLGDGLFEDNTTYKQQFTYKAVFLYSPQGFVDKGVQDLETLVSTKPPEDKEARMALIATKMASASGSLSQILTNKYGPFDRGSSTDINAWVRLRHGANGWKYEGY